MRFIGLCSLVKDFFTNESFNGVVVDKGTKGSKVLKLYILPGYEQQFEDRYLNKTFSLGMGRKGIFGKQGFPNYHYYVSVTPEKK